MNYPEPKIHPVDHTDGRIGYQTSDDTDFYWKLGPSGLKVERVGTIRAMTFDRRFEMRLDNDLLHPVHHEQYDHLRNLLLLAAGEI